MALKKYGRRFEYLLAGLAAAASFLVYLRTLQNGFINWDDDRFIYKNPHLHSLDAAFVKWAFSDFHFSNWYPLTWISHALVYALWGLDPKGYHLANIALHSASTFLVVVLTVRLVEAWGRSKALSLPRPSGLTFRFAPPPSSGRGAGVREGNGAFLNEKGKLIAGVTAGLLFGLHPLHVESVAWAVERKDVLCALFFLLSILAWLKWIAGAEQADQTNKENPCIRNPGRDLKYAAKREGAAAPGKKKKPGLKRHYLYSLLFFALALMSKPMAVSLPLVLLILDGFPLGRISSVKSFRNAFAEKLPFIVLSGCASVLTLLSKNGKVITSVSLPFYKRAVVAARSIALYLWKTAIPLNLVPYYPYPKAISFLSPQYFLPVVLVAGITVFCLLKARKNGLWLACWGYFVITLMPVLGIVQVGDHWIADRYTYLPSLGPFLAAGLAAAWLWNRAGALKRGAGLRAAMASFAILAVFFMSYLTFRQIGVWKNSIVFWNYVIEKEPGKIPVAYYERGHAFGNKGQIERAIADYNEAVVLDPGYFKAYYNLGEAQEEIGRPDSAITAYKKAIALRPSAFDAYTNLGIIYAKMRRFDMSLEDFNNAVRLNPDSPLMYFDRGMVYMEAGHRRLGLLDLRRACSMGNENGCGALQQMGISGG